MGGVKGVAVTVVSLIYVHNIAEIEWLSRASGGLTTHATYRRIHCETLMAEAGEGCVFLSPDPWNLFFAFSKRETFIAVFRNMPCSQL